MLGRWLYQRVAVAASQHSSKAMSGPDIGAGAVANAVQSENKVGPDS